MDQRENTSGSHSAPVLPIFATDMASPAAHPIPINRTPVTPGNALSPHSYPTGPSDDDPLFEFVSGSVGLHHQQQHDHPHTSAGTASFGSLSRLPPAELQLPDSDNQTPSNPFIPPLPSPVPQTQYVEPNAPPASLHAIRWNLLRDFISQEAVDHHITATPPLTAMPGFANNDVRLTSSLRLTSSHAFLPHNDSLGETTPLRPPPRSSLSTSRASNHSNSAHSSTSSGSRHRGIAALGALIGATTNATSGRASKTSARNVVIRTPSFNAGAVSTAKRRVSTLGMLPEDKEGPPKLSRKNSRSSVRSFPTPVAPPPVRNIPVYTRRSELPPRFHLWTPQLGTISAKHYLGEFGMDIVDIFLGPSKPDSAEAGNAKSEESDRAPHKNLATPLSAAAKLANDVWEGGFTTASETDPLMKEVNRKVSGATVNAGTLDNLAALPTNAPTVTNAPKTSQSQTHPQGCFWLDVFNPTEAELRLLSKVFGIHPLTIEDIEHQEIREKCDMFRSYYFVVTRFVVHPDDQIDEDDEEDGASVYSIVRKEGIISFHYRPLRDLPTVHDRLTRLSPFLSITPDWIHYALLDAITDSFAPIVDGVEMEVSNIDELVLVLHESEQSDMLRRIGQCRKDVNMMLRLLGGKMDMVRGLMKRFGGPVPERGFGGGLQMREWNGFGGGGEHHAFVGVQHDGPIADVELYLGDVQDHIITMLQALTQCDHSLTRTHSNYLAQISIEITKSANKTNDFVGKLTFFASILVPLNIVTGLFGMNVKVPGRDEESLFWWWGIIGSMIAYSLLVVLIGRLAKVI